MIYVDADAVAAAGERFGCRSANSFKKEFGGAHETWKSLLTGAPVQQRVFEFVCEKLNLNPLEVQIFPLLKSADIAKGLKVSQSSPTVVDFRCQFDPRPGAARPGGKGRATVEDPRSRLFLLFSFLELHATSKEADILIESVRMLVEIDRLTQLFHPYRWCTISGGNNEWNNPEGYWLAERMALTPEVEARNPEIAHLYRQGPEGFHLGKHGPASIKEECSFVAVSRGDLQTFKDLLDLLLSAGNKGSFKCQVIIKFRRDDDDAVRLVGDEMTLPLEHLQKSRTGYEKEFGYAATLQAFANL